MKNIKILFAGILIAFVLFILKSNVYAAEQQITYKAEYKDAISYKLTVSGWEENDDKDYMYEAYISQKTDVTGDHFFATLSPHFSLNYDSDKKVWTGTTICFDADAAAFEKQGQWYVYLCKHKSGSINYENWDVIGPTKIEIPELPGLGDRINLRLYSKDSTTYTIKVNANNTYYYSNKRRTVNFYVGEITDKDLLKKLSNDGKAAYPDLLAYAKSKLSTLKKDSFTEDRKSSMYSQNIIKDYNIEKGKYYFVYSILDNENGTYVDVEDIAPYVGDKSLDGLSLLGTFKYTPSETEEPTKNPEENKTSNEIVNNNDNKKDNTQATGTIPQTGVGVGLIVAIVITSLFVVLNISRNRFYKDIK